MENNESPAPPRPEEGKSTIPLKQRTGARADFISSLVLMGFAVVIIVECFRMPKFESWGAHAHPGFPPGVFAGLLLFTSAIIFVRSVLHGGYRLRVTAEGAMAFMTAAPTMRFVFILFSVAVYYCIMAYATFLPSRFFLSSIVFLFIMMQYFKAGTVARCAFYSIFVSLCTWLLFEKVFLVPLP